MSTEDEHPLVEAQRRIEERTKDFPYSHGYTEGVDWPAGIHMDIPALDSKAVIAWLNENAGPKGQAWVDVSDPAGVSWTIYLKDKAVCERFCQAYPSK